MPQNHDQSSRPPQVQGGRCAVWRGEPDGDCACQALELLARRMSSGWPRRGHNLLELYCADGYFLEMFRQSGFDVTGQDQDAALLARARERLRNAAEFTQAHPGRLPYDDDHFDYVVCLCGLELAEDPQALLGEMFRVAAKGLLLAFPSAWSLHCLGSLLTRKRRARGGAAGLRRFYSPVRISALLNRASSGADDGASAEAGDGAGNISGSWVSTLLGPAWSWKLRWLRGLNYLHFPFPLGAMSMVRIDLEAPPAGEGLNPLGRRAFKREPAASGLGRGSLGRMSKS